MEDSFIRNLSAINESEQQCLSGKRVLIVGCGGTGGYLMEMAARIGIGHIRVCDGDRLDATNLNRQLLSTEGNLGSQKIAVAAERMGGILPKLDLESVDAFFSEDNAQQLLCGCDAVLDGLDNVKSRLLLSAACRQAGIPYIYGAVGGWIAQAGVSMPEDRLIERIYWGSAEESSNATLSFAPAACAALELSLCVRLLCGRPLETGRLYLLDLSDMAFAQL